MTLKEIKIAIEALTEKERCELSAWLQNWPSDDWDDEMERDARAGRFAELAREADESIDSDKLRSFA